MLEISEEAAQVIERAYDAAVRFNPAARIRVYKVGDRVETGFADAPSDGDQIVEHDGMTLFVERGIDGVLSVTAQHDRLVVHPA